MDILSKYPPRVVDEIRGFLVFVVFKDDINIAPLEGHLFNIDPSTGTVFLFEDLEGDQIKFTSILCDSISSIEGMQSIYWVVTVL
jgi:hypothetical protein